MQSRYRTALVTGASRGIGRAICRRLAKLDLEVHALARDGAALAALAAETGCRSHQADVTDTAAVLRSLGDTAVDVLVSNAGAIAALKPLQEMSATEIDLMLDVNLRAPLQLIRALLPGMIERRRGHIVALGSITASAVFPGTAPYAAAKAGLSCAGRVLRYDLVGSAIRWTEIVPGRVETEIYLEAFGGDRAKVSTLYDARRALQPEDVAKAVAAALLLPEHADVTQLEIMPTDQACGGQAYATRED